MKYRFEAEFSVQKRRRVHETEECLIGARLLGWPLENFVEGDTTRWKDVHAGRACNICDGLIEKEYST